MAYIRCSGNIGGSLKVRTASGNPCTFETNLADALVSLKASILASGGGGTPSTPIPIVGISSLDIVRCGINQWDEEWESGVFQTANGEPAPDANSWRSKDFIRVKPDTSYHFHKGGNQNVVVLYFYENDGTYINYQWVNANVSDDFDFTTPANCSLMHFVLYNAASGYGLIYNNDISVNYPTTDTSYHAYNGQTFTIDLGGTRYGGRYTNDGKFIPNIYYPSYNNEPISGRWLSSKDVYVEGTLPTVGAQVVCLDEYDTPIDVSAISVNAVSGVNYVFHDGNGDTEVKYLYKA